MLSLVEDLLPGIFSYQVVCYYCIKIFNICKIDIVDFAEFR